MKPTPFAAAALLSVLAVASHAAVIPFNTDPFQGTTALTTPGRDIVGNELFTNFTIATDIFALDSATFGTGPGVSFVSDTAANLPTGGVNVIVLQTLDNDNDTTTPFLAGTAANLIANAITTSGPGFFIYFNSNLRLPRLVYSTDLSSNTADLKILARLQNLLNDPGSMTEFTAANFAIAEVPEISSVSMGLAGAALVAIGHLRRRRISLR